MKRVVVLLIVLSGVLSLIPESSGAQGILDEAIVNGPRNNRLNFVILAEGYTAAEQAKFDSDALNAYATMFTNQPFGPHDGFYNVFTIFVASNESGSDHPSTGIYRDTYFNSTFDSYGITRLVTLDSYGYNQVYALLAAHVPEYDLVLVLVNDAQYGGSGGSIAISSVHSSAPEIVMHELGHSFGNLADEYDTYTPGYSGRESHNTTAETNRDFVKWNHWFLPSTPIPTPETSTYAGVVGLFEGACYETTGWYRPKLNCKMKSLGYTFCEVCREQLVLAEYNRIFPIDAAWPTQAVVEVPGDQTQAFEIIPVDQFAPFWFADWTVDGNPVAHDGGLVFYLDASTLDSGMHTVEVLLQDTGSFVLKDDYGLLTGSHGWSIHVTAPPCCSGLTGDVDGNQTTDISDLTELVNNLFVTFEALECPARANTSGADCTIDVSDLTALVNNLFVTFAPLPECNPACE